MIETPDPRLATALLPADATLRDAMRSIDATGFELALLVGPGQRLVATVSDGDIRRALLAGIGLDDAVGPVANRECTAVGTAADRAGVLDLMQARQISQVPVLDRRGAVVGMHLLREFLTTAPLDATAVIMAGGKGTRLRPLTDALPKPMLPVAGRPILERLVLHLVGAGIRRISISVNWCAEVIVDHFGDGSRFGCAIDYLHEEPDRPLGTAGSLRLLPLAEQLARRPLLVMNGDLVTSFDVAGLVAAHRRAGADATVGAREHVIDVPFGVLETAAGGQLTGIVEKPQLRRLVNAGVYVLDPAVLRRIPAGVDHPMTELLARLIRDRRRVRVHHLDGEWVDVGQHRQLAIARGEAA